MKEKLKQLKPIQNIMLLAMSVLLLTLTTQSSAKAQHFAPVPKTGQIQSYAPRDDGDLQMGVQWPTPRFSDNGDGTVTDNLTGLIWLKNANCFGEKNWNDALEASNNLSDGQCGLSDGSRSGDWHLPNAREFLTLIDYGNDIDLLPPGNPFTDVPFEDPDYWSSTTVASRTEAALLVDMVSTGELLGDAPKSQGRGVWSVRGGNSVLFAPAPFQMTGQKQSYATGDDGDLQMGVQWPDPRFTDNGDGTVTDNLTGFVWLKNANCFGEKNWNDALEASNNLSDGQCGLSDGSNPGEWRLSNIRELRSLIDHGSYSSLLPSGHPFADVPSDGPDYWSSTTVANSTDSAWKMRVGIKFTGPFPGHFAGFRPNPKVDSYHMWPLQGGKYLLNLSYNPVTPCRIVDTRKTSAGIIGTSTQRNFRVYGSGGTMSSQGGNPAGCPAPMGEPLAAHVNMIAVNPIGKGNLQAFPVGAGAGAGLSVNYNTIDTNLSNAGTVKTVTGAGADITVASNFSSAHTVIDVLGYYYPDEGFYYTPVDPCRIVDTRKTSADIIDAGKERDFRVYGPVADQGGDPNGCPSTLSVDPKAAHLNMIAVDPTGKGNLQAFPADAEPGAGLSVNYNTIDTNLANAGTVKTVIGSGPDITVASNFSSAHTVIDVLGYYSEEEDLLYTPVKPCRIVDTRKTSAGIIGTSTQRNFRVYGSGGTMSSQGGNPAGCPAPMGEPLAAHVNMIAVNPTGKGNLQAFPVGAGAGAGLSVNYNTIDTNLANAGTVKTVTGAGADITVASNFSSAHTVIDVLGYYYSAP